MKSRKLPHRTIAQAGDKKANLHVSSPADIEKVTRIMVDLIRRQRQLYRKELSDWLYARHARHSAEYPKTQPMQDLYSDVMLDGHLTGITENRTLRTTNKDYIFTRNGIKDDSLTDYIRNKPWFETLIEEAHKSTYYGYSLLWIKDFTPGRIRSVMLIPRGAVVPEQNILLTDTTQNKGIDYTALPALLLYAQFYDPVGLLEKAAVYTILKRHSWSSWDEFEELFGIPIRIAKIASQSEVVKTEVAGWLQEMGSAPYGVFPIGTEVDIKENAKSDSFQVFYMKLSALDKELSKLVLHQTMTTDNGSSKAQGNIHENTLKEVVYADEKKMLAFLNTALVPAMRTLGYAIPDNAAIEVDKGTDPNAQIRIDEKLINGGYRLSKAYIERTYGVELDKAAQSPERGKP